MISRQQIAHGVAEYIRGDLIRAVPDNLLNIGLDTVARMMDRDPAVVDRMLSSNILPIFIPPQGDGYDLIPALEALTDTLRERGASIPIVIPGIALLRMPEKSLTFSAADIDKLRTYIERGESV